MRERFFNDYNFLYSPERDEFGREKPPPQPNFSRLPYCECGEEFLAWIKERFADLLDEPTIRSLDKAILSLSLEYAARMQKSSVHPLNSCVPEVFAEVLALLTQKRDELLRHQQGIGTAHLSIGKKQEMPDPLRKEKEQLL